MKKVIICLLSTCFSLALIPNQLNAAIPSEPSKMEAPKPVEYPKVKSLNINLYEINMKDKSKMEPTQKGSISENEKSINQQPHRSRGGIYISGSAVILIVILIFVL